MLALEIKSILKDNEETVIDLFQGIPFLTLHTAQFSANYPVMRLEYDGLVYKNNIDDTIGFVLFDDLYPETLELILTTLKNRVRNWN